MLPNGTVTHRSTLGNEIGAIPRDHIEAGDEFGAGCSGSIGDIDGDGLVDIAVGAPQSARTGPHRGYVSILFLHGNDSVKAV